MCLLTTLPDTQVAAGGHDRTAAITDHTRWRSRGDVQAEDSLDLRVFQYALRCKGTA